MSNHEADLMQLLNTAGAKGSFFLNVNSRTLIFLFNSFYSQPSLTCFSPSSPSTLVHVRPTSFPLSLLQKSGYTLIYNRATTMRVFTITTKSFEISSPTIIRWARILGHTLIWSRLTMLRFIQVRHLSHSPTPSCPSSPIHSLPSTSWVHKDYNADWSELEKIETAFIKILGVKPLYVRPPFGSYDDRILGILAQRGYTKVFMWSDDTGESHFPSLCPNFLFHLSILSLLRIEKQELIYQETHQDPHSTFRNPPWILSLLPTLPPIWSFNTQSSTPLLKQRCMV